jgi:hypothetical protein
LKGVDILINSTIGQLQPTKNQHNSDRFDIRYVVNESIYKTEMRGTMTVTLRDVQTKDLTKQTCTKTALITLVDYASLTWLIYITTH